VWGVRDGTCRPRLGSCSFPPSRPESDTAIVWCSDPTGYFREGSGWKQSASRLRSRSPRPPDDVAFTRTPVEVGESGSDGAIGLSRGRRDKLRSCGGRSDFRFDHQAAPRQTVKSSSETGTERSNSRSVDRPGARGGDLLTEEVISSMHPFRWPGSSERRRLIWGKEKPTSALPQG